MFPYGPAVLRLAVGAIFIAHGAQKLFGVWGGGGPSGDEDDKPLNLEIIAPKKPKAKAPEKPEREKVGVGAKQDDGENGPEDEGSEPPSGDASQN